MPLPTILLAPSCRVFRLFKKSEMMALYCTNNENTVFSLGLKKKIIFGHEKPQNLNSCGKKLSSHEPSFNHQLNEKVQSTVPLGGCYLPPFDLVSNVLPPWSSHWSQTLQTHPVFLVGLFRIFTFVCLGGGVVLRQGLTMCDLLTQSQEPKQGIVTFS